MTADVTIRYAQTEQDVLHIHQFLCAVAGPTLPYPIDWKNSATEVWRVCTQVDPNELTFGLMAMEGDRLVSTLGIVNPTFWWGNSEARFLANKWFFSLPGTSYGARLLREAIKVAKEMDQELHIYSEMDGRLVIFNKSAQRQLPSFANSPNKRLAAAQ